MEKSKLNLLVNSSIILFVLLFLSIYIGFRDFTVGTDTPTYYKFFMMVNNNIDTRISEPLFQLFAKICYSITPDFFLFTSVISFISCIFYFLFYRFILEKDNIPINSKYYIIFVSFLIMIISPFFWNSQLNVMRIGVAIPIFLFGSYYLFLNKPFKALLFFIISIMFHFSMIMFLPFIFLVYLREKYIILFFIFLSLIYVSGIGEIVFNLLSNKLSAIASLKYYLSNAMNERGYKNGVRYDFYVFTLFFFILAFKNRKYSYSSEFLFKLYTVLSFPFLIIGFINFSDRIIMISWSLIPILVTLITIRIFKANNFTYTLSVPFLVLISILMMWSKNLL